MEEATKIRNIKTKYKSFNSIKQNIENKTFLSDNEKQRILISGNLNKANIEIDSMEKEMMRLSIFYLNRAIEIHPTYLQAILLLGNAHYEYEKNYNKAVENYIKILKIQPDYPLVYSNLVLIFNSNDDIDFKIKKWKEILEINQDSFDANFQLGTLYGNKKNDPEQAIPFLIKGTTLKPNNVNALKNLGIAYGLTNRFKESIETLEKAIKLNPNDILIIINLGVTYRRIGNESKAQEYFAKAEKLKSSNNYSK